MSGSASDAIAECLRIHIANSEALAAPKAIELRRFLESDSQGVGSLDIFGPATPELAPLGGVRNSRNLRLHGIKLTKI